MVIKHLKYSVFGFAIETFRYGDVGYSMNNGAFNDDNINKKGRYINEMCV